MVGEDRINYIVKGIRNVGDFRSIEQLHPEDFHPVDDPNQLKAARIGDAFIEVFGEATIKENEK